MAETLIEWCRRWRADGSKMPGYTFNPWIGCQRVSPGCEHCYAEALDRRWRPDDVRWGPKAPRTRTSPAYWRKPLKWNSEAAAAGEVHLVFCASLADVMENRPELMEWRRDLWSLFRPLRNLVLLLLTKRPENFDWFLPWGDDEEPWPNVWLGTTAEDQQRWNERRDYLRRARAVRKFVSYEPAIGAIDWAGWMPDWIIAGAESGHGARPMDEDWARAARDACHGAGVAFFYKQSAIGGKKTSLPELDGKVWAQFPEVAA